MLLYKLLVLRSCFWKKTHGTSWACCYCTHLQAVWQSSWADPPRIAWAVGCPLGIGHGILQAYGLGKFKFAIPRVDLRSISGIHGQHVGDKSIPRHSWPDLKQWPHTGYGFLVKWQWQSGVRGELSLSPLSWSDQVLVTLRFSYALSQQGDGSTYLIILLPPMIDGPSRDATCCMLLLRSSCLVKTT